MRVLVRAGAFPNRGGSRVSSRGLDTHLSNVVLSDAVGPQCEPLPHGTSRSYPGGVSRVTGRQLKLPILPLLLCKLTMENVNEDDAVSTIVVLNGRDVCVKQNVPGTHTHIHTRAHTHTHTHTHTVG